MTIDFNLQLFEEYVYKLFMSSKTPWTKCTFAYRDAQCSRKSSSETYFYLTEGDGRWSRPYAHVDPAINRLHIKDEESTVQDSKADAEDSFFDIRAFRKQWKAAVDMPYKYVRQEIWTKKEMIKNSGIETDEFIQITFACEGLSLGLHKLVDRMIIITKARLAVLQKMVGWFMTFLMREQRGKQSEEIIWLEMATSKVV